tara:strand:- start:98 stop:385 length:288 start_codon:yes stop_codon:yes gene_type:complete
MSEEFEVFWDLYNYKVKRKGAESAFNRLSKKDKAALMDHLPERMKTKQFQNYTPHPTTFINGRYWEDEDWNAEDRPKQSSQRGPTANDLLTNFNW